MPVKLSKSISAGHQISVYSPNESRLIAQLNLSENEFKSLAEQFLEYLDLELKNKLPEDVSAWLFDTPAHKAQKAIDATVKQITSSIPQLNWLSVAGTANKISATWADTQAGARYRFVASIDDSGTPSFSIRKLGSIDPEQGTTLEFIQKLTTGTLNNDRH